MFLLHEPPKYISPLPVPEPTERKQLRALADYLGVEFLQDEHGEWRCVKKGEK